MNSTIGGASKCWLLGRRQEVKEVTFSLYENIIHKHIIPELGEKRLQQFDHLTLQKYLDKKTTRIAELIKTILSMVYDEAFHEGAVSFNPAHYVRVKRKKEATISVGEEQVAKMLKGIEESRFSLLYKVMLTTGIRLSEAQGMEWDDIDWNTGEVTIKRAYIRDNYKYVMRELPFTHRARAVKIPQALLEEMGAKKGKGLVFVNNSGNPIEYKMLQKDFKRIAEKAGTEATMRNLRNIYAENKKKVESVITGIKESMGYSNHGNTAFYCYDKQRVVIHE